MRLSFTAKIATYNEKSGYYLYVNGKDETINQLIEKFDVIGIEKLKPVEVDIVIKMFKDILHLEWV